MALGDVADGELSRHQLLVLHSLLQPRRTSAAELTDIDGAGGIRNGLQPQLGVIAPGLVASGRRRLHRLIYRVDLLLKAPQVDAKHLRDQGVLIATDAVIV